MSAAHANSVRGTHTLDLMSQQPGADLVRHQRVRSWITDGVTLDLISNPECIDYENTFSVAQEEDAVRLRIQEYIAFGAIVQLPDDHPRPFGVQPLHVIIKGGQEASLSHRSVAQHERALGL